MPRDLSQSQLSNVESEATRPVYLVAWEHSGVEELHACTGGTVVYESQSYLPGDVRILSIDNLRSAQLSMPASPSRVAQVQNGTYRNGVCRIYYIPSIPNDDLNFVESDAFLMLEGEIHSSVLAGDAITVNCGIAKSGKKISPRDTFDAICNHLPAIGTVITWEGDTIVLEAPR